MDGGRARGRLRWLLLALVGALVGVGGALAAPGDLDTSFSGDGRWVRENSGADWTTARDLLVQPDGSLLMVGQYGDRRDWSIISVAGDGSREITAGSLRIDFGDTDDAEAVARQADGKLVVVGRSGLQAAVARVTWPSVFLDPSFDGDGKKLLGSGSAREVLVQPDGKIVVAGSFDNAIGVVRLNPDGSLDPSFGGDGRVTVAIGGPGESVDALAMQPDGKLVLAGTAFGVHSDLLVIRLGASGDLDPDFDADGLRTFELGGDIDGAFSVIAQADGRLLVAGMGGTDAAVLRLNPDGSLDRSFAGDGSLAVDLGSRDVALDAAPLPGGKVALAVTSGQDPNSRFVLVQVAADGALDPSFDFDGIKEVALGTNDQAWAVAVQPDGRIVGAGSTGTGTAAAMAMVRVVGEPPPVAPPPAPPAPGPAEPPPAQPPPPAPAGPTCNGLAATIVGTSGDDRLKGTAGADVILGLGGSDVIDAKGGDDVVCAGGGPDVVKGGAGADVLLGQAGADDLRGGAGPDQLVGGAGGDALRGGGGADSCTGGAGSDSGLGCESGTL